MQHRSLLWQILQQEVQFKGGGEGLQLAKELMGLSQTVFPRNIPKHGSFPDVPRPLHMCVCVCEQGTVHHYALMLCPGRSSIRLCLSARLDLCQKGPQTDTHPVLLLLILKKQKGKKTFLFKLAPVPCNYFATECFFSVTPPQQKKPLSISTPLFCHWPQLQLWLSYTANM